ncbi:hypothetical protein SAMN02745823_02719 [Sporobacter termitidis DSM 10068]|uniref:Uncharacterized protein n=1 Tax=Sporobacter termitidis DSM 10068 TaxID=1123282 RepID=A0A1M5YP93_9FIRM|nr:hypothetical protein [Sporobacter termitidis]SHI13688.1 hypothetical protein SAMN02745823_02719 [Sporobacter termitidis DSM 10068]
MDKKQRAGFIAGWAFSLLFLLTGLSSIFRTPLAGVFFLMAGLVLLPPLSRAVRNKINYKTWHKGIVIAVCLILAGVFLPKQENVLSSPSVASATISPPTAAISTINPSPGFNTQPSQTPSSSNDTGGSWALNVATSTSPSIIVSPSPSVAPSFPSKASPSSSPSPKPSPSPSPEQTPASKPSPSPASIELVNLTSPVKHGTNATITIKGQPNTDYDITVYYKSGPSTASGLTEKTSNSSGKVSWTWKVGTRTTPGTWTITISGGGQSETFDFTVT